MTNSLEMAEQAFTLLRNALEESEATRRALEEQAPAPETSADALQRELQSVREERDLWKKTSHQLQDVVSNERSKAKRLNNKLKNAEGGMDRVTRKEVNFWREKAEVFEAARRGYQQQITDLKQQLDANASAAPSAEQLHEHNEAVSHLRSQLEEREARITELAAGYESASLRNEETERRIAELDNEVRGLSQQVMDADAARNEACRAADQLDAQLKDLLASGSADRQQSEELQGELARQSDLVEQYRRQIADLEAQHDSEISALRAQTDEESSSRGHEHEQQLQNQQSDFNAQMDQLRADYEQQLEQLRGDYEQQIGQLRGDYDQQIAQLQADRDQQAQQIHADQDQAQQQLRNDFDQQIQQVHADRDQQLQQIRADHDQHVQQLHSDHEHALASQQAEFAGQMREAQSSFEQRQDEFAQPLQARIDELTQQLANIQGEHEAQLQSIQDETTNHIAELEANLASERERSDTQHEIANEQREALLKTTEKLEEMEERYEDAKWRLEKTAHFEKLVRRRRKLTANLIRTIRERVKASTALKAGLDSLRRYKANADERQQELLRRVEILESSLSEAREKLIQANQARRNSDQGAAQPQAAAPATQSAADENEMAQLRKQVSAQFEVIENLEGELKNMRVSENEARGRLKEFEKLHEDLETKNTFIGSLQKDFEEQQKTVAQLRKRDIEVRELRAKLEEFARKVATLQAENKQLRGASGDVDAVDRKKIEEQEAMLNKLTAKLKEYETTINTLSEAADSWKRKYDFLAAETPYGYESASSS